MSAAFGDQLDAVDQPDDGGPGFSPYAREFPRISAALDLVREQSQSPTVPTPEALMNSGLDYLHSNLPGRHQLDFNAGGYDLAAEFLKGHSETELAMLNLEFEQYLVAATESPAPIVVLHAPTAPVFRPHMPGNLGVAEPALAAWPVPYGYSRLRVAYLMSWAFARCCYWCGRWRDDTPGRAIDFTMLISCGAVLRMFPTCADCRMGFDREIGRPDASILHFITNDGWAHSTGWPIDKYL
ncbi:hypothetical protein [Nocardia neocaledoniensis]|uniref:hypothetical protein n=1 Tax=Nocardia neocaledoniensis TaxID=236511 RepID=UPI0024578161|nr:hypothetical protein [Nocardia neocaledoniensis]